MKNQQTMLNDFVEQISYQKGIYDAAENLLRDALLPPEGTYECNCCEGVLEVGESQTCGKCQDLLHLVRNECVAERQHILEGIAEHFGESVAALWAPAITD